MDKPDPNSPPYDAATVRARLAAAQGRTFWRSVEELADDDLDDFLTHEFPYLAKPSVLGLSRRDFLKLMGASLAGAVAVLCHSHAPRWICHRGTSGL